MSRTNAQPHNPADDEFDMIEAAGFDPTDPDQVAEYHQAAAEARDEAAIDHYLAAQDNAEAVTR